MLSKSLIRMRLAGAVSLVMLLAVSEVNAIAEAAQQAGQPPTQPILRIETGMHTAAIRRIGIDRENRYLVTASDDKTARVWELASGKLLRVLRPPIGNRNDGRLYAIALSPDGRTVAVGGWTSPDGLNNSIYLFDRESGQMRRRIAGLPNRVLHLTYSPDGSRLAATSGLNGVRVYETGGYSQLFADSDYGNQSQGADFDSAGRLVTSCWDGILRLYEPTAAGRTLRLVIKRKVEGGERPFAVSFSLDASKIAVGFFDSTNVTVLSGRDLSLLFAPDTKSVDGGNLSSVAWSTDGQTLFAGGFYNKDGARWICSWADGGRGKWREVVAASNTIQQILPTRDGGVVFGASGPAFGRLDADGNRKLFVTAMIADYRGMLENLLLSAEGTRLQFGYEYGGKSPARFSLTERQLLTDTTGSATEGLEPPIISGLTVTDWKNTDAPKLNGQALKLEQNEFSRSRAISHDQSCFLLGTEFRVRLFDHSGKELWQTVTPGVAWSVNITVSGRLAVAAFGDGTIRWYRMTDGQELLAFFPHSDRKRWVLWTPSGYYDASPGAEDLIAWHVNNGRDAAADFFPVGLFRDTYYRPDVISKILKTGDESLAVKLANEERGRGAIEMVDVAEMLPPVIEIISPSDRAQVSPSEVSVRYRLRSPTGEPVTSIMAMVDGRTVAVERGLKLNSGNRGVEREIKVKVPDGASLLSILATNRFAPSVAATIRITTGQARGPVVTGNDRRASSAPKRHLYLLAIGIGKYTNGIPVLTYPAKDARDFAAAFERQKGLCYGEVTVKVLTDATRVEILDALEWINKVTTSRDITMIFISGHGVTDGSGFYYFLPSDANLDRLKATGVPFAEIENTLVSLKGQKVLFVDTCRSGAVLGRRGIVDINGIANKLNRETSGVAVFTSSMGNENAEENAQWGNGAFTRALLDGLGGQADFDHSGEITFSMLDRFITRRVHELTAHRQTPTATKPLTVPDFNLAVLK